MIHPSHIQRALEEKAHEFQRYQRHTREQRRQYHALLHEFAQAPAAEREVRLRLHDWPGALPTPELLTHGQICIPFSKRFHHHQEARAWAHERLLETITFAVDGSQLMPSKELSVPVAVVQIGWFLNPHSTARPFEKEVETRVLGPEELLASGSEEKLFHDQHISLTRFQMETERLQRFLKAHQETRPRPLAFFDGTLLVSFAEVLIEQHREAYLQASVALLKTSKETGVPLLGYIDTTAARDLVRMLSLYFYDDPPAAQEGTRDIDLLEPLLPNWGDRTIAFRLMRRGILKQYEDAGDGLGFVYLRAALDRPPVRIEFPLWLLHADLLEPTLDLVRAELIVGNGYPYPLETADQTAWFSPLDRARFTGILEQFLKAQGLDFSISRKLQSKRRRR